MIIKAYISRPKMGHVIRALQMLPSRIRAERYSADEDSGKAEGKLADESKFNAFVAKNEYGFFLFAERTRYNILLRPKDGFSNVIVDALGDGFSEADAVVVLETLARAGSTFAFAASADEYHHRNRYVRTLGTNQFEAWVGRDLRKYLPGIYWLTMISKDHADVLTAATNALGAVVTQIDAEHWLVKAFDSPNEWQQNAARLDGWLTKQPKFFSKNRVVAQLDAAQNIGILSEIAAECR